MPGQEVQGQHINVGPPEQAALPQFASSQFHVGQIKVEGSSKFTASDFKAVTAPYEGKDDTLDDLQKAVKAVNQMYWDRGYLTTQAYVPPQDINQGVITIKVVEGKVGKICINGNHYYHDSAIMRQLSIRESRVFNLKELEKDLNSSNQQNNFRIKAALSPGSDTGLTNIRLDVAERQPWQISPTFDNQGRPFVGEYRGGVDVINDSLFGQGDRLSTRYVGAAGTQVVLASYYLPFDSWGDQVGISYGFSQVDVHTGVENQPKIDGTDYDLGLLVSHPFTRDRRWIGDLGFSSRHVTSDVDDIRTGLDNIRAFQAGLSYNGYDNRGRTTARVQTAVGTSVLGGNDTYWKSELFLTRLFKLPANNLLILRGYGLYSPNSLPTAEEFQLGGEYSVRGYTEGLLLGDSGYNLTAEDRYPIPFLSSLSPWLAARLQGAVFVDFGQAFLRRDNPRYLIGVSDTSSRTLLASLGVGLRARFSQYLQGFVDVGFGLVDRADVEPKGYPTARIHFGLRSDLLPEDLKPRSNNNNCPLPTANAEAISPNTPAEAGPSAQIAPPGSPAAPAPDFQGQPNPGNSSAMPSPMPMQDNSTMPPPVISSPPENIPPAAAPNMPGAGGQAAPLMLTPAPLKLNALPTEDILR